MSGPPCLGLKWSPLGLGGGRFGTKIVTKSKIHKRLLCILLLVNDFDSPGGPLGPIGPRPDPYLTRPGPQRCTFGVQLPVCAILLRRKSLRTVNCFGRGLQQATAYGV